MKFPMLCTVLELELSKRGALLHTLQEGMQHMNISLSSLNIMEVRLASVHQNALDSIAEVLARVCSA